MTYTAAQTEKVNTVLDDMFSTFEDLDQVFEEIAEEKKTVEIAPKESNRIEYVSKRGVVNVLILETESMIADWNFIKNYSVKLLKKLIKRDEEKYWQTQSFRLMEFALGLKTN